jgi:hypothetical protein
MRGLAAGILLASLVTACSGLGDVTSAFTPSPRVSPSAEAPRTPVKSLSIAIETPFAGGEVGSPVSITGTADVAGGEVVVRVLDRDGLELAANVVEASCGDGCRGAFATELFFFTEERQPGTIEVSGSADGSHVAVASVPVVLAPA